MKKTQGILILSCSLLLAACAPTQSSGPVTLASDMLTATATIDGQPTPVTSGTKVALQTADYSLVVTLEPDVLKTDSFLGGDGPQSFQFVMKNLGTGVIKIVWDESAININGTSSIVFHNGVKYADRGNPKPATVIAPGTSTDDNVLPQDLTSFKGYGVSSRWISDPMITMVKSNTKLGLLLALDVNGKRQNVNITWATK